MARNTDLLFSTNDWVEVHRTTDEWEAKLIETTLGNQQIRCRPKYDRSSDGDRQIILSVAPEDQVEALETVSRISLAITDDEYAQQAVGNKGTRDRDSGVEIELPKAIPTAVEEVIIAEREGIGKILHYVGRGYELQVGPEPYGIVDEDMWEEFTDFSAQRQEFSILLKHEYPHLFQWLKGQKLMAEFTRLVESTYREVPPPRPRNQQQNLSPDTPSSTYTTDPRTSLLAKFSLSLSLVSVCTVIFHLPWYAGLGLALLTIITGLAAKYYIDSSSGNLKGSPIAFLAVIIACIVIAMAWKQYQSSKSEPADQESALLFMMPLHGEAKCG